jgi:hypothetical protein
MGIPNKKTSMLQKIKAFFKDRRPVITGGKTDLDVQIEIGTAIIEMLDKARVLDQDVIISIEVGWRRESIICRGKGDKVVEWLYQTVSGLRLTRMIELQERQAKESQKRIWENIERKMDGGEWGDGDFGGPADGPDQSPAKK